MKSNIRRLRNECQITQTELAHAIGKTQQAVSQMENDRDHISVDSLFRMADYFSVSTDCVLGNVREAMPSETKEDISDTDLIMNETAKLRHLLEDEGQQVVYEMIFSVLLEALEDKTS